MTRNDDNIREAIDRAMRHKPRPSWQSRMEVGLVWTLFAACLLCAAMVGFMTAVGIASVVK